MDAPALLFAYGTLGPSGSLGEGEAGWLPDAVRGLLFDLGTYPALIDCGAAGAGWVEGHVRPVTERELIERLDPYEGVDEGLYKRVTTTTRAGRSAWVYVYLRPLPAHARGPLSRWPGPEAVR